MTGGDTHERFRRDYAPAFLQYLAQGGEPGRRAAYELGRRAISDRLSILELARIHHRVLLEVLKTHQTPQELDHITQAASEFLEEALAVFEMTHRGFTELLSTDRSEQEPRRQTDMDRQQQQTVDQATGVLMERHGLSADTAAERLQQAATTENVTVDEVAARIVREHSSGRRRRSSR
jgi:ANTAR domain/Phosphoserine phosphatase RsbU, N-terminal domain